VRRDPKLALPSRRDEPRVDLVGAGIRCVTEQRQSGPQLDRLENRVVALETGVRDLGTSARRPRPPSDMKEPTSRVRVRAVLAGRDMRAGGDRSASLDCRAERRPRRKRVNRGRRRPGAIAVGRVRRLVAQCPAGIVPRSHADVVGFAPVGESVHVAQRPTLFAKHSLFKWRSLCRNIALAPFSPMITISLVGCGAVELLV